jgi:hypothetical protein
MNFQKVMSSYGMPNILVNIKIHRCTCAWETTQRSSLCQKKCMTQGCQDKKQVNHRQLMWIVQAYFVERLEVLAHVHKWLKKRMWVFFLHLKYEALESSKHW